MEGPRAYPPRFQRFPNIQQVYTELGRRKHKNEVEKVKSTDGVDASKGGTSGATKNEKGREADQQRRAENVWEKQVPAIPLMGTNSENYSTPRTVFNGSSLIHIHIYI